MSNVKKISTFIPYCSDFFFPKNFFKPVFIATTAKGSVHLYNVLEFSKLELSTHRPGGRTEQQLRAKARLPHNLEFMS